MHLIGTGKVLLAQPLSTVVLLMGLSSVPSNVFYLDKAVIVQPTWLRAIHSSLSE